MDVRRWVRAALAAFLLSPLTLVVTSGWSRADDPTPSPSPEQALDTAPPSVVITSPSDGEALRGTVAIDVDATDDVGVTSVSLIVDDVLIDTDASPPYSFDWDTGSVSNGPHVLVASASDAVPNVTDSAPVTVTVANADLQPPSRPTDLVATAIWPTDVELAWTASSDDVGVDHYDVIRDGLTVGSTATATYSDTAAPPGTTLTYVVIAYDAAGNASEPSAPGWAMTPAIPEPEPSPTFAPEPSQTPPTTPSPEPSATPSPSPGQTGSPSPSPSTGAPPVDQGGDILAPEVVAVPKPFPQLQGPFTTDRLVEIADQLRLLGWGDERVRRNVFPPFIVAGRAAWVNTWGAPRYGPGPIVREHEGQDVFCDYGAPVLAAEDGIVEFGTDELGGRVARLLRPDGGHWYYAHLSDWNTERFTSGDRVRIGDVIGFCGNTGNATASPPHVHFGWRLPDGEAQDPMPMLVEWLRLAERRASSVLGETSTGPDVARPRRNLISEGRQPLSDEGPLFWALRSWGDTAPAERHEPEPRAGRDPTVFVVTELGLFFSFGAFSRMRRVRNA